MKRLLPLLPLLPLLLVGAGGVALVAGCGQKGPLYMPDQATEIVTRPTQTPSAETPQAPDESPKTPQGADAPQGSATPAPEVNPPDKDKKAQGASPPR
jgi:predicted small lipoprotein YifL